MLRKLHLQRRFMTARARSKNVKDQCTAVKNLDAKLTLQPQLLRRRQRIVDYHDRVVKGLTGSAHFNKFAGPKIASRVRMDAALQNTSYNDGSSRLSKCSEFIKRLLCRHRPKRTTLVPRINRDKVSALLFRSGCSRRRRPVSRALRDVDRPPERGTTWALPR